MPQRYFMAWFAFYVLRGPDAGGVGSGRNPPGVGQGQGSSLTGSMLRVRGGMQDTQRSQEMPTREIGRRWRHAFLQMLTCNGNTEDECMRLRVRVTVTNVGHYSPTCPAWHSSGLCIACGVQVTSNVASFQR